MPAPAVEYDQAVARLDQPAGDVEAHLSEPNEADIHRRPSLDAPFWSVANLPRTPGCSHVRGEPRPWTPLEQLEMPVLWAHHGTRAALKFGNARFRGCSAGRGKQTPADSGSADAD